MRGKQLKKNQKYRVLVTGSRGKSSVVRMLHAAFSAAGLHSRSRITGVIPRELGPDGSRDILRSSGAHVEEMSWWLNQLPVETDAVVLENSAISPEFQGLAGQWLQPQVTVFTNAVPDHQEAWGPTGRSAAEVLVAGIPRGGKVILPADLRTDAYLRDLLASKHCKATFVEPAGEVEPRHRAVNMGLALAAVEQLGLETAPALKAIGAMGGDLYDFRVIGQDGAELAMAFSVNDITSTRGLFGSLGWSKEETRLVYNHRRDRLARFRSFTDWLKHPAWREVLVIGDRPALLPASARFLNRRDARNLLGRFRSGERIFGCGNIAGLPLSLYQEDRLP